MPEVGDEPAAGRALINLGGLGIAISFGARLPAAGLDHEAIIARIHRGSRGPSSLIESADSHRSCGHASTAPMIFGFAGCGAQQAGGVEAFHLFEREVDARDR